jgi:hypothetical protein
MCVPVLMLGSAFRKAVSYIAQISLASGASGGPGVGIIVDGNKIELVAIAKQNPLIAWRDIDIERPRLSRPLHYGARAQHR